LAHVLSKWLTGAKARLRKASVFCLVFSTLCQSQSKKGPSRGVKLVH
jgi:hypothetical protein